MSRSSRRANTSGHERTPPPQSALDELRKLRQSLAASGNSPKREAALPHAGRSPTRPADSPAASDEEDQRMFRREVSDVQPIGRVARANLDKPKPSPMPRARDAEADEGPPSPRRHNGEPRDDAALFRAMMEDVTPLDEPQRADTGAPRARLPGRAGVPVDPHAKPSPESAALLLPDDAEGLAPETLFRHAVRGARPIAQALRVELERPRPGPEPIKRGEDEQAALREAMEAPITLEDRLEMGDEVAFLRPGLPRRVLTDLRKGRWVLQGELDLHGLNREEARAALAHFLFHSLQKGARCVRVIHGKGLGSPGKVSILKQLSRGWLAQREEILGFCQAGPNHGGSGALMVLLRGGGSPRR